MNSTIRPFAFVLLCSLSSLAQAQSGSNAAFQLLTIPSSARSSSLGGNYIAVRDADLNLGIFNPALLNKEMTKQVALSYLPYFAGTNVGYVSYGHHLDSCNVTLAGTVQYMSYGSFDGADEVGNSTGQFNAGEFVVQVGASKALDSLFSVGANLKFVNSNLSTYNSTAWAVDVGGVFEKKSLGLSVAAMLRNIGYQSSRFTNEREKLPFEAMLGVTYRFKHAPFRLGLMFENLQKWDLTFNDPNARVEIDPTTGEVIEKKVTTWNKRSCTSCPVWKCCLGRTSCCA
ncbi:MAG: type IX secretion system protein PorQ [Flavobacteriales bacterium]|nr:type IX secretion system protein PorQ [Flavobacteriales bacterium]